MVEGCKRWLREGLGDPPEVTEASVQWQRESDRFPAFVQEKCVLAKDLVTAKEKDACWVRIPELWSAYQNWCEENKEHAMKKATFDERLEALGCRQGKRDDGKTRVWRGIRFRTDADEQRDNGTGQDTDS
jgi:putative DNA primase/helicase